MEKVHSFLVLSFLALFLINITLIGAYFFLQYGSVTLSPGENYTVNIPFFGKSKFSVICGKAETNSGEALQGVNINAYYKNNSVNKSTTDSKGRYCIYFPEINSNRKYDIFIEYNNQTSKGDPIQLASNDYSLDFTNNLIFRKSSDQYAILNGSITNEDAKIENGRFEINLQYWPSNSGERYEIFDYQRYSINIDPKGTYNIPDNDLNVSWKIPDDVEIGRYKFFIKTSFNAEEKTKSIFFNISA